jgi:predicted acetyltransferase
VALWRVVGSSASQVAEVTFQGAPQDPLFLLLPEQDIRTRFDIQWMLRLVDAPGAIAARGFLPGVEIDVDVALRDRHCPWNDGRWRLVVSGGHGRLEPGGTGAVRVGVGPFASLYSGWCGASTLARTGLLTASSSRAVAALDAAFAGPTPWMPDFF